VTGTPSLRKYLEMTDDIDNSCCLAFWQKNKQAIDLLFEPALRAVSVPVSSAPVERIISHD